MDEQPTDSSGQQLSAFFARHGHVVDTRTTPPKSIEEKALDPRPVITYIMSDGAEIDVKMASADRSQEIVRQAEQNASQAAQEQTRAANEATYQAHRAQEQADAAAVRQQQQAEADARARAAKQGEPISTPPGQKNITIRDDTAPGGFRSIPNPSYEDPSTKPMTAYEQANLAHQQALEQAAQARQDAEDKRADLARQVELGKLKANEALDEYNRYIQQTVTIPLQLSAEARNRAAEERQQAEFTDRQQQERVAYEQRRQEFALTAGQDAVSNYLKQMPYMVGPAFGGQFANALNVLGTGKGKIKFTGDAFTYDLPDLDAIARQHVAEALANVSPAAQAYLDAGGMLQPSKPVQYPTDIPSADLSGAPAPYHASDQFDQDGNYIGP